MHIKLHRLAALACTLFISLATHGHLFHPLGLGNGMGEQIGVFSQPQMHVEGSVLYVCTKQGLYSKDLSTDTSSWQLSGFKDIALQDYVRRGDDILALHYSEDGDGLLLSHDNGKTYEDVTPDLFKGHKDWSNVLVSITQHPTDPNTLLVLSPRMGICQSSDFGQTWTQLTDLALGSFIGYNPSKPEIICNSGADDAMSPLLNISYDGGQTWKERSPYYPGDNCIYRLAFHPTNPEKWIAGAQGAIYESANNGQTWNLQRFMDDVQRKTSWNIAAYDNENSDIIYMAGHSKTINVMCSTDGGESWGTPLAEYSQGMVNDFLQYGDKLLIYAESDVYEISKAELLTQSIASAESITAKPAEYPSKIHDLQGRHVNRPTRGVYVMGGKKFFAK